ncbi:MAG: hypothetical protein HY815_19025 [Candidatus Riflebacteria bacterium]|nr:hypothetical protein [Candidatus Riflebacteria bacterium]
MIRKTNLRELAEEKRKADDQKKLRSKWITDELERRLLEVGGFSRNQLYNRRGGPAERGLTSLLETGDQIVDVLPGRVVIKTREGTIQSYYNMEKAHDFLQPVPGTSKDPAGEGR